MAQLENIEAIEARLWRAADLLRSGSELASNEYFMPVMGLIFLRHAYSRFLAVKPTIDASLPSRGRVKRALTKGFQPKRLDLSPPGSAVRLFRGQSRRSRPTANRNPRHGKY
jgi:hypothetical protein